jgi:hypothetical protein
VGLLALAMAMVGFMFASAVLPGHERLNSSVDDIADLATIVPSLAAFISLPTVGAILAVLRPRSPIGWLLLLGGVALVLGDFSLTYVERSIEVGPELPGYRLADWLAPVLSWFAYPLLIVWLPLLFPDGRLPGRRWRIVGLVAAVNLVVGVAAAFFTPQAGDFGRRLPNPTALGGPITELVWAANAAVAAGLVIASVVAVIVRFRRSQGTERQQMKWLVASVVLVAVAILALAAQTNELGWAFFMSAIALLPVAIGIAVLRYRLYEIDRLISRTIGWAIVTGLLVGAFAVLVLGLQAIVEPLTGGNTLAIAGSTLVVAALFQPLRSRVQRAVDRRFDRSRYDGERLLAAFGERLRDEVDLTAISADVLATVDAAVRPSAAGLWLRQRPGSGA